MVAPNVWTGRLGTSRREFLTVDITVGSARTQFGRLVAPEWGWVRMVKRSLGTWPEYRALYARRLEERRGAILAAWADLVGLAHGAEIRLGCYCRDSNFCHRKLLAEWLAAQGVAVYRGEA